MKKVTLWYTVDGDGNRKFNHLEDGWKCDFRDDYPKPIKEEFTNQTAWKKQNWEKEEAYMNENCTVIPFSCLYKDEIQKSKEMELIRLLNDEDVAVQITLDIGKKPTVHAIAKDGLVKTDGLTLMEALLKMDKLLFEE